MGSGVGGKCRGGVAGAEDPSQSGQGEGMCEPGVGKYRTGREHIYQCGEVNSGQGKCVCEPVMVKDIFGAG